MSKLELAENFADLKDTTVSVDLKKKSPMLSRNMNM